jgi:hypothetical protein
MLIGMLQHAGNVCAVYMSMIYSPHNNTVGVYVMGMNLLALIPRCCFQLLVSTPAGTIEEPDPSGESATR